MPKAEPTPNHHHYRVWIKWAIESGLIEILPPLYDAEGIENPQGTEAYAHHLLAELRDPDSSKWPLKQIIADARQFKSWVEARRRDGLRILLCAGRPEERISIPPRRQSRALSGRETTTRRTQPEETDPRFDPMWDNWIDSLNQ